MMDEKSIDEYNDLYDEVKKNPDTIFAMYGMDFHMILKEIHREEKKRKEERMKGLGFGGRILPKAEADRELTELERNVFTKGSLDRIASADINIFIDPCKSYESSLKFAEKKIEENHKILDETLGDLENDIEYLRNNIEIPNIPDEDKMEDITEDIEEKIDEDDQEFSQWVIALMDLEERYNLTD
jgi:hypothetical protein